MLPAVHIAESSPVTRGGGNPIGPGTSFTPIVGRRRRCSGSAWLAPGPAVTRRPAADRKCHLPSPASGASARGGNHQLVVTEPAMALSQPAPAMGLGSENKIGAGPVTRQWYRT